MRTRPTAIGAAVALSAAIAAGVLAAASTGSGPGTGAAKETARTALPAEKRSIAAAVKNSPLGGLRAIRAKYNVRNARVSLKSPFWATAQQVPKPAFRDTLEGGYSVLVRLSNPQERVGPWVVVDTGTAGVGCLIAPISVLRDLAIAGDCAPGERL